MILQFTPSIRQLTEENVIQQEFPQPGKYTLTLNVFNAVSSVYYRQTVDVYGKYIICPSMSVS